MAAHPNQKPWGVTRRRVYHFWLTYWHEHGYAPTERECAEALGLSKGVTRYHVLQLEVCGWIEADDSLSIRKYRITKYIPKRQEYRSA